MSPISFYSGTQTEVLYAMQTPVTKNTYTTQAVMSALPATAPIATVPAGFFSGAANRALLLKASGTIATTAAATFALAIGLDSTASTLANGVTCFTTVAPTASVTAQWDLEVWYTCQLIGTSGGTTVQVNGKYQQSTVATGGALQSASPWTAMFAGNLTGLVSNAPYFVELFGTWSASAAGNTTTIQQEFLLGLN